LGHNSKPELSYAVALTHVCSLLSELDGGTVNLTDNSDVARILKQTIVLPTTIFPLPRIYDAPAAGVGTAAPAPPNAARNAAILSATNELTALAAAHTELKSKRIRDFDLTFLAEQNAPSMPIEFYDRKVNTSWFSKISG